MRRRLSVWAYPWDLADEGVAAALDWLRDAGFDAIELCPNYHAISTFAPRNLGRSIHYSEQGAVYFPARAERYGRIEPRVFDEPEVLSAYTQAAEHAPSRGIQLNAWVIGMFQPWIARAYPDTAIENVFGARSFATTCPASPDVQEYLAALVGDLCDQYPVHSALLERPGHPEFAYGWVRERILIDLDPWTRFLAGLCFCENCLTAARTHGVDALEVRESVARELRERLSSKQESGDLECTIAARAETDEEFRGYLEAREQSATRLVEGVHRALRGIGHAPEPDARGGRLGSHRIAPGRSAGPDRRPAAAGPDGRGGRGQTTGRARAIIPARDRAWRSCCGAPMSSSPAVPSSPRGWIGLPSCPSTAWRSTTLACCGRRR